LGPGVGVSTPWGTGSLERGLAPDSSIGWSAMTGVSSFMVFISNTYRIAVHHSYKLLFVFKILFIPKLKSDNNTNLPLD
jgi:hypothetical protein